MYDSVFPRKIQQGGLDTAATDQSEVIVPRRDSKSQGSILFEAKRVIKVGTGTGKLGSVINYEEENMVRYRSDDDAAGFD